MAKENGEYFIGIGKQDFHSFAFVGVVKNNIPTLCARDGKYCLGFSAVLQSELWVGKNEPKSITYQAYSITQNEVNAYKELMGQIVFNNFDSNNHYCCMDEVNQENLYFSTNEDIEGYIRVNNDKENALYYVSKEEGKIYCENLQLEQAQLEQYDKHITSKTSWKTYTTAQQNTLLSLKLKYAHERLIWSESPGNDTFIEPTQSPVLPQIQNIRKFNPVNNTCRTTALTITKHVLGFTPKVSQAWWVNPDYKTKVYQQQLYEKGSNFYIFPSIPEKLKEEDAPLKNSLLKKMFARLTAISKTKQIDCQGTYEKFVALKTLYKRLSEVQGDNLSELHTIIKNRNDNDALKHKRAPNFFSRNLPNWDTSTTSKLLNSMEMLLAKKVQRQQQLGLKSN